MRIWIIGWYKADRKVRHVVITIIGSIQEITNIESTQEDTCGVIVEAKRFLIQQLVYNTYIK